MFFIRCLNCDRQHIWFVEEDLSWRGIHMVNGRVICQCGNAVGLARPSKHYPSFKGKSFRERGVNSNV